MVGALAGTVLPRPMRAATPMELDWKNGTKVQGQTTPADEIRKMDLTPKAVTAALIGVESPLQTFALQRGINDYPEEPLLAILPGVALQELWSIVGVAETALLTVPFMQLIPFFASWPC